MGQPAGHSNRRFDTEVEAEQIENPSYKSLLSHPSHHQNDEALLPHGRQEDQPGAAAKTQTWGLWQAFC